RLRASESDLGGLSSALSRLEFISSLETEQPPDQHRRKPLECSIVIKHCLVVIGSSDVNTVLCAGELILEILEILVSFQVRVVLRKSQQPAERPAKLIVSRSLTFRRLGVQETRARLSYVAENLFFVFCVTLYGVDQIRYQVRAPL